jgi:hypothetical protein
MATDILLLVQWTLQWLLSVVQLLILWLPF